MANRASDWLKQAERDLEHAKMAAQAERFEWTCVAAHQAAEKAVKAVHLSRNQEAWGHVVARLLAELPDDVKPPKMLSDKAHVLDNFYIPTRNPDSHPEGAPFEHYSALQGEEALRNAGEFLAFARDEMAKPRSGAA